MARLGAYAVRVLVLVLVLAAVPCTCAQGQGTGGNLSSCDLSGEWLEYWNGHPADDEVNTIREDIGSGALTLYNTPAKFWRNGTGQVLPNGTVTVVFPHNPSPGGRSVSLTGRLAGTSCAGLYVFWDNDSTWCKRISAATGCATPRPAPPPSPPPPAPPQNPNITKVHVIQSCHLDIGFADTASGIVNRWFDHHFPMMIQVAEELRQDPSTNVSLQFMAQSYLVSLYLDCPTGMGISCPTSSQQAALTAALKRGDVYYHAFPFNSELELYDPTLIREGIAVSHNLDDALGLPHKTTLSQRDVPGITRAIIPILTAAGINAVSVGVNTASSPPQVPNIFRWQDPGSGTEVLAMWHPRGYGGFRLEDAAIVPEAREALVFDWNGDNAGPYDAATYKKNFAAIRETFPNAEVVSSTFDAFVAATIRHTSQLPLLTQEIGDTWLYGCPSDPIKGAKMRGMNRAWKAYLAGGGKRDPVYLNATRLALKAGEHTWGLDVKSNLKDNAAWANADFHRAKTTGPARAQFQVLETSWERQRNWSYGFAMEALTAAGHPLGKAIAKEWAGLSPELPHLSGFTRIADPTQHIDCGSLTVSFETTGALATAIDKATGINWAGPDNPLLYAQYSTYSQLDFAQYIRDYTGLDPVPEWALHDFGKPNDTVSEHALYRTSLEAAYVRHGDANTTFLIHSTFPASTVQNYGAPAAVWLRLTVDAVAPRVDVAFTMLNKTLTRLPETLFLTVTPPDSQEGKWEADKLGSWVGMLDVVNGGSTRLHGVMSGFRFTPSRSNHTMTVLCTDAGIVAAGQPSGFPTPLDRPGDLAQGFSSMLLNNLWGTNYVMWPFWRPEERAAATFRYGLVFT